MRPLRTYAGQRGAVRLSCQPVPETRLESNVTELWGDHHDRDPAHRPAPLDDARRRRRPLPAPCGNYPAMSVDGLWCDFTATNVLVDHDLIRPAWPVPAGGYAPAILTQNGAAMLATLSP